MTDLPRRDGAAEPLSRRSFSRRNFGRLTVLGLAAGAGSVALGSSAVAAGANGREHYDRARRLAGEDPVLLALVNALTPGFPFPRPPAPAPLKIFDNLAMLSVGWVSAMAVLTDDGIVLIDALTSPAEAESVLVPGLREVGADPGTIRYIVVTHGHEDHFGGAQYLADRYGARVLMSPADWDLVGRTSPAHAPTRDLEIADGQRLTVGGTTIRLHHTPGHTPGTVSPIIPLRAGRERHTAMLWGGTNPPTTVTELRTYLASIHSFRARMRQANVDVELSNHPNDHGLQRLEELRSRPDGANPFVLGRTRAQRYMAVMDSMLRGRLADAEGGDDGGDAAGDSRSYGASVQGCC
ncbi:MBL fold metallo-hydrolase [Streptomyces jeddahensis]|uniref:Metallo-beta-lactamase L1 n=1 Tax=Streptomyces jeddahensis TaxID=1716141 RepID=A0A177HX00_9ACTN|nr:MBL fold metallo-hydrolase [Streptomyces jeddahensis]OAH15425.1 metallo-beta-lactamase L1 precursor [Streptomyces jeddahensis]